LCQGAYSFLVKYGQPSRMLAVQGELTKFAIYDQ
jgi:hypothetical protein